MIAHLSTPVSVSSLKPQQMDTFPKLSNDPEFGIIAITNRIIMVHLSTQVRKHAPWILPPSENCWLGLEGNTVRIGLATPRVICKSDQHGRLRLSSACVSGSPRGAAEKGRTIWLGREKAPEQSQHPNRPTAFKCALVRLICATVVLRCQRR